MRNAALLGTLLLFLLLAGCATRPPPGSQAAILASLDGDLELVSGETGTWPEGTPAAKPNFVWEYETLGWREGNRRTFHEMKTTIRLLYDPEARTVRSASVTAARGGNAFRHVCITPGPDGLLMIRMATLLDYRGRGLTVVKVHGPDPSTHTCEEIGVGPADGFMEGFDVLFKEDGSFTVLPGSNAYLAGSKLRLERTATLTPDLEEKQKITLPR